jgi:hypothetical protein
MNSWAFIATSMPFPSPAAAPPGSPADIRDIVPPQPYFLGIGAIWLALGALCLVLAGWALWRYFLRDRMRRPPPRISPRALAEARLSELERQLDALDARLFGGEVCEVLRAYIGAQYGLHPERQTSPEFLESMAGSPAFTASQHGLLAEFLEQCDLLKFARHEASLEAKRRLLAQAREFVNTAAVPLPSQAALAARA